MMSVLLRIFTWWNGATVGTLFHTWRKGEKVGEDQYGNQYYQTRGQRLDPALGIVRRWVIYKGEADASMIPAGWYGWMHHKLDVLPHQENYISRAWEKPHQPNLTGSAGAYRPHGSILQDQSQSGAKETYKPWNPA